MPEAVNDNREEHRRMEREITATARTLPGNAPLTMPANFWLLTAAELEEARAAVAAHEAYKRRVNALAPVSVLRLVSGGEEDVAPAPACACEPSCGYVCTQCEKGGAA